MGKKRSWRMTQSVWPTGARSEAYARRISADAVAAAMSDSWLSRSAPSLALLRVAAEGTGALDAAHSSPARGTVQGGGQA